MGSFPFGPLTSFEEGIGVAITVNVGGGGGEDGPEFEMIDGVFMNISCNL